MKLFFLAIGSLMKRQLSVNYVTIWCLLNKTCWFLATKNMSATFIKNNWQVCDTQTCQLCVMKVAHMDCRFSEWHSISHQMLNFCICLEILLCLSKLDIFFLSYFLKKFMKYIVSFVFWTKNKIPDLFLSVKVKFLQNISSPLPISHWISNYILGKCQLHGNSANNSLHQSLN
jgi:hypothetical protein